MELLEKIKKIISHDASSGILLLISTVMALIFANLPLLKDFYHWFLHFGFGDVNVEFVTNDILMAIFFFTIGLELKRERLEGQLRDFSQIFLPCFAAVGGVIFPALIFTAFNFSADAIEGIKPVRGWAIPTATDIAFTIGIMAILGKKIPFSLKIFVLTLAVMDDLYAILIIALFYNSELSFLWLILAAICVLALLGTNRAGVNSKIPFILLSMLLWFCVHKSGVHATISGVIAGFTIPLHSKDGKYSMLEDFQNLLHHFVNFFVMPLFAFVNIGIYLGGINVGYLFSSVPLGIMLGLFLGKQVGIFLFSFIAVKLKFADLPEKANWKQLYAVAILCGIGFTMSLFVDMLAFKPIADAFHGADKLAILLGSALSGLVGYFVAKAVANKEPQEAQEKA